jgi:membrane protease YdiL (CAAX protease family)
MRFATLAFVDNNVEAPEFTGAEPKTVADLMVSPNNPPWNGWMAMGVWILSVLFILVVPLVFLAPYLVSKHIDFKDRQAVQDFIFTDPTAILLQLAPVIVAHILTFAVAWAVVTRFGKYSFRQTLGWRMGGFHVWQAIAITVGFYAVAFVLLKIFGDVENDFDRLLKNSQTAIYLVAFFATFTAPIVEELVYRGIVYSAFQRRFGVPIAVIFATVLFTAVHVPQYSQNGVPDYASVLTLLLLSLVLTLVRARTGNLLPCVVLHTVFNGTQSLFLILQTLYGNTDVTHPAPDPTGFIFHLLK